jgi:hypothetical protein
MGRDTKDLYRTDFYAWANEQARLLRRGEVSEADIANIAEEIESMGRSEKRELVSRLTVLCLHLLKWQFQPALRSASWQATIRIQRRALARHLADNPSLRRILPDAMADAYADARLEAELETGLVEAAFPEICPFGFEQASDPHFYPGPDQD